jgi:hypothetical protein
MTTTERPTITAPSMLIAQSVKLDSECNAWMVALADRTRSKTGDTGKVGVSLPVFTSGGALIGHMTYMR